MYFFQNLDWWHLHFSNFPFRLLISSSFSWQLSYLSLNYFVRHSSTCCESLKCIFIRSIYLSCFLIIFLKSRIYSKAKTSSPSRSTIPSSSFSLSSSKFLSPLEWSLSSKDINRFYFYIHQIFLLHHHLEMTYLPF